MCSHNDILDRKCSDCDSLGGLTELQASRYASLGFHDAANAVRERAAGKERAEAEWERKKRGVPSADPNASAHPLIRLARNRAQTEASRREAANQLMADNARRDAETRRWDEQQRRDEAQRKREWDEQVRQSMARQAAHHNTLIAGQIRHQKQMAGEAAAAAAGRTAAHRAGGGGGGGYAGSGTADGFLWDPPVYYSGGSMADGFRW